MHAISGYLGYERMMGFRRLFDIGNEQSFPTYVSAINLLLAAILLHLLSLIRRNEGNVSCRFWRILSVLFLWLSIDESIGIHEIFGNVFRYAVVQASIPPIVQTHEWLPFGFAFLVIAVVVLLPGLRTVPRNTVQWMFVAGAVFVVGAVGFEYLGALMLETGFVESRNESIYIARRVLEESFEMYGIGIFNWAIYREAFGTNTPVITSAGG